jgi:hypothetical protein
MLQAEVNKLINSQSLIRLFCICQILEKKWEYNESTSAIHRFQESL